MKALSHVGGALVLPNPVTQIHPGVRLICGLCHGAGAALALRFCTERAARRCAVEHRGQGANVVRHGGGV